MTRTLRFNLGDVRPCDEEPKDSAQRPAELARRNRLACIKANCGPT